MSSLRFRAALTSATVLALCLASAPASAAFTGSRALLGTTDLIDWAQLGLDTSTVASGAVVSARVPLQLTATLGNPGGPGQFTRFDEGGGTWAGNFTSGDALLTTFDGGGGIRLDFSQAVARVGTQIQGLDFGSFSGTIAVYDSSDTLLELHTRSDNSVNRIPDGSALYLGIARQAVDIRRVEFSITSTGTPPVFGINQVDLSITPVAPPVPEPSAAVLALLGLGGLGLHRRLRRQT